MHQKNYSTGSLFNTSKLYILKLEDRPICISNEIKELFKKSPIQFYWKGDKKTEDSYVKILYDYSMC
jgi:hypothetical protein